VSRGRLLQVVTAAVIAASWLSLVLAIALDQNPQVIHGQPVAFSESQQAWARALALVWLALGAVALLPAAAALHYADTQLDRALALTVLAAAAAVPIVFYFLATSGYFAEYGS